MQSSFDPNASERRWPGSAIQEVSTCDYWPATSSSSAPLYHHDYYPDYNSHSSSYPLPALSPTLSPCSSAGSTKSPSADYVWDGAGLYILDDDQHRHFSSSSAGDQDREEEGHDVRVKSEPIDTSFIIEAPAPFNDHHCVQAPTTIACPSLRATHATKDMKKMMGVFRLDPFIFKDGTWRQEENTGLKEEPEYLQFYLEFDLGNVFEQCMWSPQPEEHAVSRTYRDEPAGIRDQHHPSTYSNQQTYAYDGG